MQTQQQYCGHWSDDDLTRSLRAKLRSADAARRELSILETEMLFIQSEQRERYQRAAAARSPVADMDWSVIEADGPVPPGAGL